MCHLGGLYSILLGSGSLYYLLLGFLNLELVKVPGTYVWIPVIYNCSPADNSQSVNEQTGLM